MSKSIEERENELEIQTKAQKKIPEKQRELFKEQREREKALDDLEAQIVAKEADLESWRMAQIAKEKELREREEKLSRN